MSKDKKFSFIPENQLNDLNGDTSETVSISSKGLLNFSKSYIQNYDLENAYIKVYADPQKKAIAWIIFDQLEAANNSNLKLRKMTPYGPQSEIKISISKIMKSIGIKFDKSRRKLPVKKYHDLLEKKTFFYVELN